METQLSKNRAITTDANTNQIGDFNTERKNSLINHRYVDPSYNYLTTLFTAYNNTENQDIESVYNRIKNKDGRNNKEDIVLYHFLNSDNTNMDKIRDIIASVTRSMIEIAVAYERELEKDARPPGTGEGLKAKPGAPAPPSKTSSQNNAGIAGMSPDEKLMLVQLKNRVKKLEDDKQAALAKEARATISAMMGDSDKLGQNFRFDVFYPENSPFFKLTGPNGRSLENEVRNLALDTMKVQIKELTSKINEMDQIEIKEMKSLLNDLIMLNKLNSQFKKLPATDKDNKFKIGSQIQDKKFDGILEQFQAKFKQFLANEKSLADELSRVGKDKLPNNEGKNNEGKNIEGGNKMSGGVPPPDPKALASASGEIDPESITALAKNAIT